MHSALRCASSLVSGTLCASPCGVPLAHFTRLADREPLRTFRRSVSIDSFRTNVEMDAHVEVPHRNTSRCVFDDLASWQLLCVSCAVAELSWQVSNSFQFLLKSPFQARKGTLWRFRSYSFSTCSTLVC
mmetsp:Transcript_37913/g.100994  ORF Transcript_37913/g.100994 Transcript_37913/m.100994 type:complete len:129 (-) Transcript_37913:8-394(-)